MDKVEAATIRGQLTLRKNPHSGAWEVWSRVAGQNYSKWIIISDATKEWYITKFNPPIIEFTEP